MLQNSARNSDRGAIRFELPSEEERKRVALISKESKLNRSFDGTEKLSVNKERRVWPSIS